MNRTASLIVALGLAVMGCVAAAPLRAETPATAHAPATVPATVPATAPAVTDSMPPDIAAILTRGKIVVAMTSFDNPPFYSGTGEDLQGIDVTLAHQIGDALGVSVEFDRSAQTFNDVVNKIATGEADIAVSKISRTYARSRIVAFSKPYVTLRHALVFNRLKLAQASAGRDIGDVVRNFSGTLGVIENSSFAGFAVQRFPHAVIVPFKTWQEVVDATIAGQVEASYRDEFEIRKIAVDKPDATISLRTVTIGDAHDSIAVVAAWNAPRLLAIVDQVIENSAQQISADTLIELYRSSGEKKEAH